MELEEIKIDMSERMLVNILAIINLISWIYAVQYIIFAKKSIVEIAMRNAEFIRRCQEYQIVNFKHMNEMTEMNADMIQNFIKDIENKYDLGTKENAEKNQK